MDERYEALASAPLDAVEELADMILAQGLQIEILSGPETVSAPIRVAIPGQASLVPLGHVVLSRCAVLLDGVRGDGIRRGRDLPGAVAAAVCDAEAERRGRFAAEVARLCAQSRAEQDQLRRERARVVEQTRVDRA